MSEIELGSVFELAVRLAEAAVAVEVAAHHGLERAAKLIERDAKSQLGHYQDAVGPFPDWAPLAQSTEEEKARLGFPLEAPLLRTGALGESIQHEVSGLEAVVGSKSDVAAYQEFGTKYIPPRPFIGPAAFKNKDKIQRILGAAVVQGLVGGAEIHKSLGYDMDI